MHPHAQLSPIFLSLLAGLGLVACGDQGGAPGSAPPLLDEGSYEIGSFGYENPHPVGFHPLGRETVLLDRSCELVVIGSESAGQAAGGEFLDVSETLELGSLGKLTDALGSSQEVFAQVVGNLDDDGADELVLAQATGGGVKIVVLELHGDDFVQVDSVELPLLEVWALATGDVDGDHLDEIVLTHANETIVLDDLLAGMVELERLPFAAASPSARVEVACLDIDFDGRDEIALGYLLQTFTVRLIDDAAHGFAELDGPGALVGKHHSGFLLGADLDGDGSDELVVATKWSSLGGPSTPLSIEAFAWSNGLFEPIAQYLVSSPLNPYQRTDRVVAYRQLGESREHLAFLLSAGQLSSSYRLRSIALGTDPDASGFVVDADFNVNGGSSVSGSHAFSLAAGDLSASGGESVWIAFLASEGSSTRVQLHAWNPLDDVAVELLGPLLPIAPQHGQALLTMGDFDGDGFQVRATGVRTEQLADPIPLVLLSAAPTKSGVAQNYGGTSTSYLESASSGEAIGVATQMTVSRSAGFEVGKFFSASAKRTIEESSRTSQLQTQTTTTTKGFGAGYESDAILFQGTLYESYEYEVLSSEDPDLIGSYFTLDNPVVTKTYKWTVAKYDAVFPEFALGSLLLPHVVGDPTSYRTRAQVEALAAQNVGWSDPELTTVGETISGANSTAVELSEQETSEQELSYAVTDELGFSIGPFEGSVTSGLTDSRIYSVTTSASTSFEAFVGDIHGADWDLWHYDFGMAVYTHGLPAGGGSPTEIPLQVITFWVDPVGAGY